jgi:hypothetical protein
MFSSYNGDGTLIHSIPQRFGSEDEWNNILPLEPQQIFTLQQYA